jgi:acyl carrier protein
VDAAPTCNENLSMMASIGKVGAANLNCPNYQNNPMGYACQMDTLGRVRVILRDTLSLGDRANQLMPDSQLLGGLAEFDSLAVVSVVTMLEDELGITVNDDELSADVFATVGALVRFVDSKLGQ